MNSASTTMVLAEAILKTADLLGLSNTQLAAVIGVAGAGNAVQRNLGPEFVVHEANRILSCIRTRICTR